MKEYLKYIYFTEVDMDVDPIHSTEYAIHGRGSGGEVTSKCKKCAKPFQNLNDLKALLGE